MISVADSEIFQRGGTEDSVTAPSSFIANAHSELVYAFYTGKRWLTEKN